MDNWGLFWVKPYPLQIGWVVSYSLLVFHNTLIHLFDLIEQIKRRESMSPQSSLSQSALVQPPLISAVRIDHSLQKHSHTLHVSIHNSPCGLRKMASDLDQESRRNPGVKVGIYFIFKKSQTQPNPTGHNLATFKIVFAISRKNFLCLFWNVSKLLWSSAFY